MREPVEVLVAFTNDIGAPPLTENVKFATGMGDVLGVERRAEAHDDNHDEEQE